MSDTPEEVFAPDASDTPKEGKQPPAPIVARYEGRAALSPYGMSRLAPHYTLVDVAQEIEKADTQMATMTGGKLLLIAEQIRALQEKAKELLDKAQQDAELHRAKCNFEKRPGGIYHLYRDDDGALWWSLIAPEEWRTRTPNFAGTYRLEHDMSFTDAGKIQQHDDAGAAIRALLGPK
jgi:Protein of unknown function (DUF2452)